MKTVAQVIQKNSTSFNVIAPDMPAIQAFELMNCENCDHVVVKAGDFYLGLITEADYYNLALKKKPLTEKTTAKEIMNSSLPIVNDDEPVEKCMQLMHQFHKKQLPVFREMKFIGVISMDDIIREAIYFHDIFDEA